MSQITDMGFPPGPVVCSLFVDTTRKAMICWPSFDKQWVLQQLGLQCLRVVITRPCAYTWAPTFWTLLCTSTFNCTSRLCSISLLNLKPFNSLLPKDLCQISLLNGNIILLMGLKYLTLYQDVFERNFESTNVTVGQHYHYRRSTEHIYPQTEAQIINLLMWNTAKLKGTYKHFKRNKDRWTGLIATLCYE